MNKGGTTGYLVLLFMIFLFYERSEVMKDNPKVGIGILIFNDVHEVLLLLRNSDKNLADSEMRLEGTWTLPAGKVKYGETLLDSVYRKVKEETNLEVLEAQILSIQDDINEFAHYVTIGSVVHKFTGDISLGSSLEHIEYGFFPLENLPANLCEPSRKIIEKYLHEKVY